MAYKHRTKKLTRMYGVFKLDRVVGIKTRYGPDGPEIEPRCRQDFPHPSRQPLASTQPPVQLVPGLFPGWKAAGAWRWPSTPSSAEVKEGVQLYLYSPFWAFMACSRVVHVPLFDWKSATPTGRIFRGISSLWFLIKSVDTFPSCKNQTKITLHTNNYLHLGSLATFRLHDWDRQCTLCGKSWGCRKSWLSKYNHQTCMYVRF